MPRFALAHRLLGLNTEHGEHEMKKALLITPVILSVTCLVGGACFFLFVCPIPPFPSGSAEDFVTASEEPMTLDEARQQLRFELPEGANNIMYSQYAYWIAYEFTLKFEAPPEVCKKHALLLIENYNRDNPDRPLRVELRELDEPPNPIPSSPPTNVTWFDVHKIKNGFFAGSSTGSHKPRIWVDADRGVLYYRMTD